MELWALGLPVNAWERLVMPLEHLEQPWNTFEHLLTPLNTLKQLESQLDTFTHHRTPWNTQKHYGTHWNAFEHLWRPWNTLEHHLPPWNTMKWLHLTGGQGLKKLSKSRGAMRTAYLMSFEHSSYAINWHIAETCLGLGTPWSALEHLGQDGKPFEKP